MTEQSVEICWSKRKNILTVFRKSSWNEAPSWLRTLISYSWKKKSLGFGVQVNITLPICSQTHCTAGQSSCFHRLFRVSQSSLLPGFRSEAESSPQIWQNSTVLVFVMISVFHMNTINLKYFCRQYFAFVLHFIRRGYRSKISWSNIHNIRKKKDQVCEDR